MFNENDYIYIQSKAKQTGLSVNEFCHLTDWRQSGNIASSSLRNDALSILKKSVRKEQPDKSPFSKWTPKLIDLLKQKSSLIDYLYAHVCDYNTNRMSIESNTERILKRQDEILARVNELRCPLTIIPPNVNGLFLRGYHLKLRYVIIVVIAILLWAVAASVSSMKYKEESFAHCSMYLAVKEQHECLMKITGSELKRSTE